MSGVTGLVNIDCLEKKEIDGFEMSTNVPLFTSPVLMTSHPIKLIESEDTGSEDEKPRKITESHRWKCENLATFAIFFL